MSRCPIALGSSLEGIATFRTPSRRTLPSRIASADPLSHASDSAVDLSLYRSMSIAKCASWPPESGQTSPTITTTEVVAKTAAFGGSGGAQGGSIREHRRVLCRGSRRSQYQRLLGPRGSLEPQGSDRAGLLAPTGGTVGRSTLG